MSESLVLQALANLDPCMLGYDEWLSVGMALEAEGYGFEEFANWSRQNKERYKSDSDLMNHWRSFGKENAATPVKGGTIVELAKRFGWAPPIRGHEVGWDEKTAVIDPAWIETEELPDASEMPSIMIARYLEAMFDTDDIVGYVTESIQSDDGHYIPANKGYYTRTAGELLEGLSRHPDDIGLVFGDTDPQGGAWVRINPLDGGGVRNANVLAYKYSLVECDTESKAKQLSLIHAINLPCAAVVDSGGKSIHALVHVDAKDYAEYRERVDFLYKTCKENGLPVDESNKNPSRLSRLPGVWRGNQLQTLIETNSGAKSWTEWKEWLEAETDKLPDAELLSNVWDSMPELAPYLIDGVLRQGHKMMLAGPSKAGKSFALMELCIAIAEGTEWMGFKCAKGPVMYINLEIDRASCLHRFKDLYASMRIAPNNLGNIAVWSLRGKAVPMDQLAPKLIRRAKVLNPIAVIIDPIYKIITGDENSASDMANFTNQFDTVSEAIGTSVIICHHHSKGYQGAKRSMDRLSGSGVFARDPDTLIDMSELYLDKKAREWANGRTGWRLSFTLREFKDPGNVDVWFDYPRHYRDEYNLLMNCGVEGDPEAAKQKGSDLGAERRKEQAKADQKERVQLLAEAVEACYQDGAVPTRTNVLFKIGEYKGKAVTEGQLKAWTSPKADWSPFKMYLPEGEGNPANAYIINVKDKPVEKISPGLPLEY